MPSRRTRVYAVVLAAVFVAGGACTYTQLPAIGAGGLLHPARSRVTGAPPAGCQEVALAGAGVTLQGWRCPTGQPAGRGTVVYLHGIADNRTSARGAIDRFQRRGLDVVAFDSRAHGESDGEMCTYGYWEMRDLARVLDALAPGPIVLIGTSLGAAVALQHAAEDPRVSAVVAAETFSDLRTVAIERAPRFFTAGVIARAFEIAEERARFDVDAVSPRAAAGRIMVPVLLIHGEQDVETPPAHSRRVYQALAGPKRLILVPGAGHNQSLRAEVWLEIEHWVDNILREGPAPVADHDPGAAGRPPGLPAASRRPT